MAETIAVAPTALAVRGLAYSYPRSAAPALDDVWLELEPGTFTVLAGGSGSGKSTLLRAACGLVPHFHGGEFGGDVVTCGMSVRDNGPNELAQACGTLLQEPESQVVMGGVRAEIALALEHRGASAQSVARAVEEAALALGIGNLLDRRTQSLSGGELQRVALAAAIAHRPALLLLDEPTSQLDPVAGEELIWLLRRLNEEWGTTVVVAEHRLERCLPAADRVVAMDSGRIAFDGSPHAFLDWAVTNAPEHSTSLARLFSLLGLEPPPVSVKEARMVLQTPERRGLPPIAHTPRRSGRKRAPAAAELRGVWHEIADGPAILRGVDMRLEAREVVALMGRNGAGKSTLLRHLKGLASPTRGKVDRAGEVALLLQHPGDYLVREHVGEEVGAAALDRARLAGRGAENPRDLSGGERQRLALEVALGDREWACVCLDEPTRGIDRAARDALAARVRGLASGGAAVVIATHDVELAAELADRVVLMGAGEIVADGSPVEVLAGGWHFATDVARALGPEAGVLTPEEGARALAREELAG